MKIDHKICSFENNREDCRLFLVDLARQLNRGGKVIMTQFEVSSVNRFFLRETHEYTIPSPFAYTVFQAGCEYTRAMHDNLMAAWEQAYPDTTTYIPSAKSDVRQPPPPPPPEPYLPDTLVLVETTAGHGDSNAAARYVGPTYGEEWAL